MSYGEGPQGPGQPFGGPTPPSGPGQPWGQPPGGPGVPPPGGQPGGAPGQPGQPWQPRPGTGGEPWSQPPGAGQAWSQEQGKTNGLAVASLVLGIVGCFGVTALVALVLGFVGRSQIKSSGGQQKGSGMATAGIVLGFLWIGAGIIFTVLAAAGTFDETDISRADFVDEVSTAYYDDQEDLFGTVPEGSEAELRDAYDEFAGCVYDVLEAEPDYLEAVYDDPTSQVVTVFGVSQSRIDELDDEVESDCVPELDSAIEDIVGG